MSNAHATPKPNESFSLTLRQSWSKTLQDGCGYDAIALK